MVRRFLASRRTGFFSPVAIEGEVGADDKIDVIDRDPQAFPVSEITRLYVAKKYNDDDVSAVAPCPARFHICPKAGSTTSTTVLGEGERSISGVISKRRTP